MHREIGLILLDRRDFAGAASAFQIAAQQDPEDRESRYNLALSLSNAGQKQQGLRQLRAFCSGHPIGVWLGSVWDTYTRCSAAKQTRSRLSGKRCNWMGSYSAPISNSANSLKTKATWKAPSKRSLRVSASRRIPRAARFRLAKLLRQTGRREESLAQFRATRDLRDQRGRGEQAAAAYAQEAGAVGKKQHAAAHKRTQAGAGAASGFSGKRRAALAEAYQQQAISFEQAGNSPGRRDRRSLGDGACAHHRNSPTTLVFCWPNWGGPRKRLRCSASAGR